MGPWRKSKCHTSRERVEDRGSKRGIWKKAFIFIKKNFKEKNGEQEKKGFSRNSKWPGIVGT